jgi:hypothetical protein
MVGECRVEDKPAGKGRQGILWFRETACVFLRSLIGSRTVLDFGAYWSGQ